MTLCIQAPILQNLNTFIPFAPVTCELQFMAGIWGFLSGRTLSRGVLGNYDRMMLTRASRGLLIHLLSWEEITVDLIRFYNPDEEEGALG